MKNFKNMHLKCLRRNKTARTTYNGSGVGLSIVKKTVELLGGKVDFVSEEGKGTVFTVELVLKIDKAYEEAQNKKEQEAVSISGLNILVAEDNELNLEIETYMLESG